MQRFILVGIIRSAVGTRGQVRVESFCQRREDLFIYRPLTDSTGTALYEILTFKPAKGGFLCTIKGIYDRSAAQALRNSGLYTARANLFPPEPNEFYHADLLGLAAYSPDNQPIGEISRIFNYGAGDILEIGRPDGASLLVHFTEENVPAIDLRKRRIVLCVPNEL